MKFKVDQDKCIGCGACHSICEEIFDINKDGYAEAKDIEVTEESLKDDALSAKEGCPTDAIEIQEDEKK